MKDCKFHKLCKTNGGSNDEWMDSVRAANREGWAERHYAEMKKASLKNPEDHSSVIAGSRSIVLYALVFLYIIRLNSLITHFEVWLTADEVVVFYRVPCPQTYDGASAGPSPTFTTFVWSDHFIM
ncbi:hypothetical protein RB195_003419 [Necator americanus]|uniref:Uncharacterized protein n=1 Tax=Necator americanus TaxID=51031 RepID=A0ABR1DNH1_NECAM